MDRQQRRIEKLRNHVLKQEEKPKKKEEPKKVEKKKKVKK